MRFRAILFDLDGTLIDSVADIADACNRVLAARGYPVHERGAYRYFVGEGVRNLLLRALPPAARGEAMVSACMEAYNADYARSWHVRTRAYPGIPEMLAGAARRGLRLAVLSNKPHAFTVQCVEELLVGASEGSGPRACARGSEGLFDAVLGATGDFPHKPDPAAALHIARILGLPAEAFLYVGDTATDMATAQAAGMWPLGVLWGFREAEELRAAGARALVRTPAEILDICAGA